MGDLFYLVAQPIDKDMKEMGLRMVWTSTGWRDPSSCPDQEHPSYSTIVFEDREKLLEALHERDMNLRQLRHKATWVFSDDPVDGFTVKFATGGPDWWVHGVVPIKSEITEEYARANGIPLVKLGLSK